MAKTKQAEPKVNKSQAIRDYLTNNRRAKPKQIADDLKEQLGIVVSTQMVSTIKSKFRKGKGRKKNVAAAAPSAARKANSLTAKELFAIKDWAEKLGGVRRAQEALETLLKLSS